MTEPSPPQNPYWTPPAYGYSGSAPVPQQASPVPQQGWPVPQQSWPAEQPAWGPLGASGHVVPTSALASPGTRLGAALLNVVLFVLTLGIGYLVWALVLWSDGTNPGKKIFRLVTVKADTGQVCTWGDMCLRNFVFGYLVMSFAGLFTLYIANVVDHLMVVGERRQRLIDKMAGTLIVQR